MTDLDNHISHILHILRNPWGWGVGEVRENNLNAADLIEALTHRKKIMQLEQIAIASDNPSKTINLLNAIFGLVNWSQDIVSADAYVFDAQKGANKAELNFNYELGVELEVLQYLEGDNWHTARVKEGATFPFISHMGCHCTEAEAQAMIARMALLNVSIAQEVFTTAHTNPVIKDQRLYHYIVFDSSAAIGFDLKLIVRRDVDVNA